jgi:glycerol-3-phosphate acyltransferase PlsY
MIAVLSWLVLVRLTKTASISSLSVMAVSVPLAMWQGASGLAFVWLGATIALIVWRHRTNIGRVFRGDEQKVAT